MLRVFASFIVLAFVSSAPAFGAQRQNMKDFIDHLMGQMTDAEKVGQLAQYTADMAKTGPGGDPLFKEQIVAGRAGSIFNAFTPQYTRELQELAVNNTRLKIPLLFGYDVIHGHRTIFPIPLAEAASWDLALMEKSARIAATEAAADGLHWTFAPMVDIARDPRWGRIAEGAGEDTWLGSKIAAARVRGFQGEKLGPTDRVLACVKHFAAYGAPIGGRDYNTVDISPRSLMETYLPPYRAAITAGVGTVMTAFNEINGVPSTSNHWLLTGLLRNLWGFDGFVVTDFTAIKELVNHGVADTVKRATELAFTAGVDMDMETGGFNAYLLTLLQEGKVSREQIDRSVRRILEAKYRLGLFDDPFRFSDEGRAARVLMAPQHLEHAREIARRSIVLLKNSNDVLPLKAGTTVALIGALSDDRENMLGTWAGAGDWNQAVPVKEGLQNVMGSRVRFVFPADNSVSAAVQAAQQADVVVMAAGEPAAWSGEAASRTVIRLPAGDTEMLKAVKATGKPTALVVFAGRPLVLEEESRVADSIVMAWHLGTQAGLALADVLSGDYNPSGKLPVTFPWNEGQIPIYYAAKNSGRPFNQEDKYTSRYLDAPNEPLWPFGWGLSYTKFQYSNLRLSTVQLDPSQVLKVQINVANQGIRAGEETVQLYVRDLVGSVTRPVKELRGFKKVFLQPGENRLVTLELRVEDLKFYDDQMRWTAEPGDFHVMVGGNSDEVQRAQFTLLPAAVWMM